MKKLLFILLPLMSFGQGRFDLAINFNANPPVDMSTNARALTVNTTQLSVQRGVIDNSLQSSPYSTERIRTTSNFVPDTSGGGYTISFWAKQTAQNDTVEAIWNRRDAATQYRNGIALDIPINSSNMDVIYWLVGSNTMQTALYSNVFILNTWVKIDVVATLTGGAGSIVVYVNAKSQGTTLGNIISGDRLTEKNIMCNSLGVMTFRGNIDHFRLLNRPKTAQEVKTDYDNQRGCY